MPDVREDLEAWLADDAGPAPDLDQPPPPVQDPTTAERYLRKLARLKAEKDEVEVVAAAEHHRIEAWERDRLSAIDRAAGWVRLALEAWFRARRLDGGSKTLDLPAGRLKLRAPGKPAVQFDLAALQRDGDDGPITEQAALARLREDHPTMVRVTYSLDRAEVHRLATPGPAGQAILDGAQVVPGVRFVVGTDDRFDIEVAR
jgi:hypothetical protein